MGIEEKDRRDIDRRDGKERGYGTIIVRTKPSGAIVTVEGESKTTPAIFDVEGRMLPYNIEIKMDGYEDHAQIVVVPKGSEIRIETILTKIR